MGMLICNGWIEPKWGVSLLDGKMLRGKKSKQMLLLSLVVEFSALNTRPMELAIFRSPSRLLLARVPCTSKLGNLIMGRTFRRKPRFGLFSGSGAIRLPFDAITYMNSRLFLERL